KEEFRGVLSFEAELLEPPTPFEAYGGCLHDDETYALRAGRRIRLAGKHDEVTDLAVRDVCLLAVYHIVVAIPDGARSQFLQIAAAVGLGEAEGSDELA